jgi:hypothetical protein
MKTILRDKANFDVLEGFLAALKIALVLIEKGYDTQQIHEITGLTDEEIEKRRAK